WAPLAQVYAPKLSQVVEPRAMSLRVAAVGASGLPGAYAVVDLDAPTIDASKVPGMEIVQGVKDLVGTQLVAMDAQRRADIETLATHVATMGAATEAARLAGENRVTIKAEAEGAAARALVQEEVIARVSGDEALAVSISTVSVTATNAAAAVTAEQAARIAGDTALATRVDSVEATLGAVSGSVRAEWVVAATPSGAFAAYQLRARVEASDVGFFVVAQSGAPGYVAIDADRFFIRSSGGSPFAAFDTVGGNVYMRASMYLDGSITTAKVAAGAITTDRLTVGGVTTDRLYPNSVTASVAGTWAGTTVGGSVGGLTIPRTSGAWLKMDISFRLNEGGYTTDAISSRYFLEIRVVRAGPSGTTTFETVRYALPPFHIFLSASPSNYQHNVGLNEIRIQWIDNENLSAGNYEYKVELLRVIMVRNTGVEDVAATSYANGVSRVVNHLMEFKR
ncbi:MAG: hypothetical protein AB1698_22500, partial [Pseudomonadota bacterium]